MAITSAVCNSFKTEVLRAIHNFTASSGNSFKLALYTSSATLNKSTTAYSSSNEISNTSGSIVMAPTPDANYLVNIYGNAMPVGLGSGSEGNSTTYISNYFPQGLLYACLAEAYGFLKGPTDMLTLYTQKYTQELQKFAAMQIGRRRRDDYTDGTIRIPIESPPQ